jgi:hypothetical protein
MLALFFALAALAFYSMSPLDKLEHQDYPQAQAAVASMIFQYKAAQEYLFIRNKKRDQPGFSEDPYVDGQELTVPQLINAGFLQVGFKANPNIKTYVLCVDKSTGLGTTCNQTNSVDYVMTYYTVPQRYDSAGRKQLLTNALKKYASSYPTGIVESGMPAQAGTSFTVVGATNFIMQAETGMHLYLPSYFSCRTGQNMLDNLITFAPIGGSIGHPKVDPVAPDATTPNHPDSIYDGGC